MQAGLNNDLCLLEYTVAEFSSVAKLFQQQTLVDFFFLYFSCGLLRVLSHVLMQIGIRFIDIFKISDSVGILGFNKKTSREIWEKKCSFCQYIIMDNKS